MGDNDFATGYALGQNDNGGMGGFGGSFLWVIVLFALMFGGFGGFGFGGFGGGAGLQGIATRADINAGFQFADLQNAVRSVQQGICDSTYALNNTIVSGFHAVDRGLCDVGYSIKDCCFENRAAIADLKYTIANEGCTTRNLMQTNTRDIIDATNAGTRAVLDFLVQDKISTLTAENQNLKFAASQANQNAYLTATMDANKAEILRRVGYDPSPAYLVQPPTPINFPINSCGTVQLGYRNNACGCNC